MLSQDVVTAIQQNGQLEWADQDYYLWRFTARPRPPAWAAPCDDRLAGAPGCWSGTLDRSPGYAAEESPAGITRVLAACPGQTTAVQVQTGAAPQPVAVSVQFDNAGPFQGRSQVQVGANRRDIAAATAPPGATQVTVALNPPPGAVVRSARIGTVGSCKS